MRFKKFLIISLILIGSISVFADDAGMSQTTARSREEKKLGMYVSILGDPFPSIYSVNGAYNINDHFRANLGVGMKFVIAAYGGYTFGGGIKYFFLPNSNFSPVAGVNLTTIITENPRSGSRSADLMGSTNLGIDWQLASGLDLGAGANLAESSGLVVIPYINLGWFF